MKHLKEDCTHTIQFEELSSKGVKLSGTQLNDIDTQNHVIQHADLANLFLEEGEEAQPFPDFNI